MVRIYVLDVPEFAPLVEVARRTPEYRVSERKRGYFTIESDGELRFARKELDFRPAVWYGAFTGGIEGRIVEFGRDVVRIAATSDAST
jgi:hypothetical protein